MTFRIDYVFKAREGAWMCDFKGVDGDGIYGMLTTDAEGRGLYLKGSLGTPSVALLPPTQFTIPLTFSRTWARERFAAALWFIKWGPEVREYGPGAEKADAPAMQANSRPDTAVEDNDDVFPRDQIAEGAVAGFFAIVKEWGLSPEEARMLLGNISPDRFDALHRGDTAAMHALSDDEIDRLTYLIGIHEAMSRLYVPESHSGWLRNESKVPAEAMSRPWGTGSPLGYLLTGKFIALTNVYGYLNAELYSL